jgi:NAD(P)-dependent dehydrogenase (short-subunit alcohol dehydrogenase family)
VKGQKVLIVGGNSGVGLALATKLTEKKASVIIASRSALKQTAQLQAINGLENCQCFSVDITREDEIRDVLAQVGSFDHLVITVKSPIITAPFLESQAEDVRHAFETKFWGQYNFAKLAAKHINKNGSITFSSGTLSNRPYEGYSTMSVIAGAVESLCKALAIELSPIRVNAVAPGFKTLNELKEKIPLGLGSDEQISNPYLFLINDSYITGTTIVTDGGAVLV